MSKELLQKQNQQTELAKQEELVTNPSTEIN